MPDRCSLPECGAISNRLNGKISVFRFPRDPNLRAKWLKSIGKKDWKPPEKAVICEKHFEPSCIMSRGQLDKNPRTKPKIALGSLPTILVPPGTPGLMDPQQRTRKVRKRGKQKVPLEEKKKKGRKRRKIDLDQMLSCFLCNETTRDVLVFNAYNFEKCHRMSQFRRAKGFKYSDIILPRSLEEHGYHINCYRKFVVLKDKYRKDYDRMFNIPSKPLPDVKEKICLFCGKSELKKGKFVQPIFSCSRKIRDMTKNLATAVQDSYLLSKLEEAYYFDYHSICRTHFVDKCRKFMAHQSYDHSMPLQQRLTAIATTSTAPEQEKAIPTLKSQPLSPTKLKVTRQSASKPQQQQQQQPPPEPVQEEVQNTVREEICLKWNTHHSNMQTAFPALLNKEQYCDVTLVAEGISLKCHKLILSSCSAYFDQVLEKVVPYQHPIIFMKDIPFNIMKALCDFMYVGEVNILQSDLDQILAVGESLKIKGLANKSNVNNPIDLPNVSETPKVPVKPSKVITKPSIPEKNDSVNDADVTDPLDLMEPTYEEAATPDIPPPVLKRNDQTRKSTGKRVRKRKHVEVDHEPSPPVFRMRKGTRSRPNVKVPRYFNANFDNSLPTPAAPEPSEFMASNQAEETLNDPFMNILDEIKTEPLDIEDTFEEDTFMDEVNREPDAEEYDPVSRVEEPQQKVLKKRRVSRSSAVTKQEKSDPLNVDNMVIPRHAEEMHVDNCDRMESQEENYDREERLEMPLESSDREEMPKENSDKDEMPIENSDKEERMTENIEREVLQLQNSDFSLVVSGSIDAMEIENSEYEERLAEDVNREEIQLENCEQGRLGEVSDGNETIIENSETEQLQSGTNHTKEIQIDYREETHLPNSEEVAAMSDIDKTLIENNDKREPQLGNSNTQEIQNENIHQGETQVYSCEGQEIMNENNMPISHSDSDGVQGESNDMEGNQLGYIKDISGNCHEEEASENYGIKSKLENTVDAGSSEEKLDSIQDDGLESKSEENKRIPKENSLDEVLINTSVQEGCNSNVLSTTEEDPLQ